MDHIDALGYRGYVGHNQTEANLSFCNSACIIQPCWWKLSWGGGAPCLVSIIDGSMKD